MFGLGVLSINFNACVNVVFPTDFASQSIAWISHVAWAVITVSFWIRKPSVHRVSVATRATEPFARRIMNAGR